MSFAVKRHDCSLADAENGKYLCRENGELMLRLMLCEMLSRVLDRKECQYCWS